MSHTPSPTVDDVIGCLKKGIDQDVYNDVVSYEIAQFKALDDDTKIKYGLANISAKTETEFIILEGIKELGELSLENEELHERVETLEEQLEKANYIIRKEEISNKELSVALADRERVYRKKTEEESLVRGIGSLLTRLERSRAIRDRRIQS